MIKVFIPIKSDDILNDEIKNGIINQSIETNIELIKTNPYPEYKRKGEFEARDIIVNKAKEIHDEYIIVNDADTLQLHKSNFKQMIKFLNNNILVGAVTLWDRNFYKYPECLHIRLACTMWRTDILKQMSLLKFEGSDFFRCCCNRYKQKIEELGYQICYLDKIKRIKEIGNKD